VEWDYISVNWAVNGPTLHPSDETWVNMEQWWNDNDRVKPKDLEKTPVLVLLCPPQICPGSEPRHLSTCAITWPGNSCNRLCTRRIKRVCPSANAGNHSVQNPVTCLKIKHFSHFVQVKNCQRLNVFESWGYYFRLRKKKQAGHGLRFSSLPPVFLSVLFWSPPVDICVKIPPFWLKKKTT
jgi:hypothetical protein